MYDSLHFLETWLNDSDNLQIDDKFLFLKNVKKCKKKGRNPGGVCTMYDNKYIKNVEEIKCNIQGILCQRLFFKM